jgi:hypothetical protein
MGLDDEVVVQGQLRGDPVSAQPGRGEAGSLFRSLPARTLAGNLAVMTI